MLLLRLLFINDDNDNDDYLSIKRSWLRNVRISLHNFQYLVIAFSKKQWQLKHILFKTF